MHRLWISVSCVALLAGCPAARSQRPVDATPAPTSSPEGQATPTRPEAPQTVDALAEAVFSALKAHDEEAFGRLIATDDDMILVAETYEVSEQKARAAIYLRLSRSLERVAPSFDMVHDLAQVHGMSWEQARLEKVEHGDAGGEGLQRTDAMLRLVARDERFAVQLDDCTRVPRGWVLTDRMSWLGLQK